MKLLTVWTAVSTSADQVNRSARVGASAGMMVVRMTVAPAARLCATSASRLSWQVRMMAALSSARTAITVQIVDAHLDHHDVGLERRDVLVKSLLGLYGRMSIDAPVYKHKTGQRIWRRPGGGARIPHKHHLLFRRDSQTAVIGRYPFGRCRVGPVEPGSIPGRSGGPA
jgi:hypothetical protein